MTDNIWNFHRPRTQAAGRQPGLNMSAKRRPQPRFALIRPLLTPTFKSVNNCHVPVRGIIGGHSDSGV